MAMVLKAQLPMVEVPNEIEFGGMILKPTIAAKKIIQDDVNKLMKLPKYTQIKIDLANLYFPLMEKLMEEENFPTDFKFLALQESSLDADAVSSSNAVGYWQFKKESAIEVGIRVDSKVDERKNIIAATSGAIKYLKRNNQTFDNWVYALLSYNLGLTGAKNKVDTRYYGARKMEIDENTHWYVLRFIAHKLAFQNTIGRSGKMDLFLVEYIDGANKSLAEIAQEQQIDLELLKKYNRWLKADKVPDDKIYSVILPVPFAKKEQYNQPSNALASENKIKKASFQTLDQAPIKSDVVYTVVVNKTKVILARRGDTPAKLAFKGGITREEFFEFNEMKSFEEVKPFTFYYLEKKRNKAMVLFHTVQYGERLWEIAHNYGVRMEALRDKNRMDETEALVPGRVLYLRTKRPKNKPVEMRQLPAPKVPSLPARDTLSAEEILKKFDIPDTSQAQGTLKKETQDQWKYHTVAQGETIFSIARLYKIPNDSLVEWNQMRDYKLNIGQSLIVGKEIPENKETLHTVLAGETLYKIATLYKVSPKEILEWNNKTDNQLKVGEKLIIRKP
jgi:membrane-bound lytic murein transglycosylase D